MWRSAGQESLRFRQYYKALFGRGFFVVLGLAAGLKPFRHVEVSGARIPSLPPIL